jgi:hypothetical protein
VSSESGGKTRFGAPSQPSASPTSTSSTRPWSAAATTKRPLGLRRLRSTPRRRRSRRPPPSTTPRWPRSARRSRRCPLRSPTVGRRGSTPRLASPGGPSALGSSRTSEPRRERSRRPRPAPPLRPRGSPSRPSEVAAAREELARLTPIAAPSELPAAVAAAAAALVAARDTLRALEAGQQARAASVADATRIAREAAEAARAEVSRCAARVEAAAAQVASAQARAEQLDAEVARRDEAGLRATRDAAAAHFATVANSAEAGPDEAAVRALDARVAEWTAAYEDAQREVHRGQGALEHTGGTVADERLRDAVAAVEYAEQREAEVTVEYRGWQLLHQVLLDAERDQAANLGAAAAPLVVGRLRALTGTRYDSLVLDPNLHTEGVVSAGKIRAVDRLSVGTREQLATLLRLCLAERLGSAVVLDDQLVQSDLARMSRFHSFLHEVAERAQVVVFTCRRGDYLDGAAPPNVIDTDLTAKIRPFR